MRVLLDTHIVLWYIVNDSRMSAQIREIINSRDNEIYYSIVSLWEVAIKRQISRARMPVSDEDFSMWAEASNMRCLLLRKEHIAALKSLKRAENSGEHHDPFDRMLICQAKTENMTFLTHDKLLRGYEENCILCV